MIDEVSAVREFLCEGEHSFRPSLVVNANSESVRDGEYRKSLVSFDLGPYRGLFQRRLESYFPWLIHKLGLPFFAHRKIEMQITSSGDGDFFRRHRDNSHKGSSSRKITFVYYCHEEPAQFRGGSLHIYSDREADNNFIALTPTANLVLFFPSDNLHEVMPVQCTPNLFANRRLTINGWFHS
jgi:Rps23 Pro-64 3,4-dihydroxylase Tpa1-like proline 4-hydroxylase